MRERVTVEGTLSLSNEANYICYVQFFNGFAFTFKEKKKKKSNISWK